MWHDNCASCRPELTFVGIRFEKVPKNKEMEYSSSFPAHQKLIYTQLGVNILEELQKFKQVYEAYAKLWMY